MPREWVRANRGFCIYLAAVLGTLLAGALLYFLWGHWAFADSGWTLRDRLSGWLGQDFADRHAYLEALDEAVAHLFIALVLVLPTLGVLIFRPRRPPAALVTPILKWAFLLAVYVSVAQAVVFANARDIGFHNYWPSSWDKAMHMSSFLRSPRPFMALLVKAVVAPIPEGRRAELRQSLLTSPFYHEISARTLGGEGLELELAVGILLNVLFLTGAMFLVGSLAKVLYAAPEAHTRFAVPVFVGVFVPVFYNASFYLYDMPCLFFCAAAYYLIVTRRLRLFHLLYLFALANKETYIVMSVTFAWYYADRLPWRRYLSWLALQGAFFVGFRVAMLSYFGNKSGTLLDTTLLQSLHWLLYQNVWYFFRDIERSAYFYPMLYLLLLVIVAFWRFPRKHPALRAVALPATLFLVPCMIVLAFFSEWRDYYEIYPLFVLLAYESVGPAFDPISRREVFGEPVADSFLSLLPAGLARLVRRLQ